MVLESSLNYNPEYSTHFGSFWTNDFQETLTKHEKKELGEISVKGKCLKLGFKSVALIPIKFNEEVLGMFQINCFRKYAFTLEDIYFIERLSSSIGVSIHQKETKRLLEISESALNRAQKIAKICSWTNMGTGADHTYNISKNIEDIMGIVPDNGTVTLKQIIEVIHKDDKKNYYSPREKPAERQASHTAMTSV